MIHHIEIERESADSVLLFCGGDTIRVATWAAHNDETGEDISHQLEPVTARLLRTEWSGLVGQIHPYRDARRMRDLSAAFAIAADIIDAWAVREIVDQIIYRFRPLRGFDVYSSVTNNFAACTFEGRFPSWDRAVRFIQSEENAPTDIVVYRGEWERGTGRRAYHVNYADGTPYKHYIVNPEGSPAPGTSE